MKMPLSMKLALGCLVFFVIILSVSVFFLYS